MTEGQAEAAALEEMDFIEKMIQRYESGKIRREPWLDRLTFRRIEEINQANPGRQDRIYVLIELDMSMRVPMVLQERETSPPRLGTLCTIADAELTRMESTSNPIELKSAMCSGSVRVENLQPTQPERYELRRILNCLPTHHLERYQKALVFKARYFLKKIPKALPVFLRCVDWALEDAAEEAVQVMHQWTPVGTLEALQLLSPSFRKQPEVRKHAVAILDLASDEELECFLLQLVQALRYEDSESAPLADLLCYRAARKATLAIPLFWYLHVEWQNEKSESRRVSECRFGKVLSRFMEHELTQTPLGAEIKRHIDRGSEFINLLRYANSELESSRGLEARREKLCKLLAEKAHAFEDFSEGPLPISVLPNVMATGLIADKASVMSSACAPLKVRLATERESRPFVDFMIKNGDDLRQDQLVMQVIAMCDRILKNENVDLELVTFRVLATDTREGIVEFVPDCMTLYDIQKAYGALPQFLLQLHPDPMHPGEINPKVLDTYIKSTAGYCVMTYLLGVGDRHLENLMLTKDGNVFHIDFGFILGRKPFAGAAPTRITHEMVEAMGGTSSKQYARFTSFACEAFNALRKHAGAIIHLFSMMQDSGIVNGSANAVGDYSDAYLEEQFESRFCLSKSDEDAAADFERLLTDSQYAIGSRAHDFFHDLKVRTTR